jgi:peptidoglycan hydrolase-like protein with peptidoglycan-binding domain
MTFSLVWLAEVLKAEGLKVAECSGWEDRGRGEIGPVRGVMLHHTAGPARGNMPSLRVITEGRPERAGEPGLAGPLAQLGLGRDGTFYVVAAGRANHAGAGEWRSLTNGNQNFIGIEAENSGTQQDAWPDVQMDAFCRGTAALLRKIGANETMCCGHREYALPPGRKIDPLFDMNSFRRDIAALLSGGNNPVVLIPDHDTQDRPTLRRGATDHLVQKIQTELHMAKLDGNFDGSTEAAVRHFQSANGLVPDGIIGPKTWEKLDAVVG